MIWSFNTDAGLFDEEGKLLGSSSSPIQIWKDGACVEVNFLHRVNGLSVNLVTT